MREIYLDWLEPIFVIRSDSHKRMPNQQRQLLRAISWAASRRQVYSVAKDHFKSFQKDSKGGLLAFAFVSQLILIDF